MGIILIIYFGLIILMIASVWRIFEKSGYPGWASLVPIYNLIVHHWSAGVSAWLILLYFVPFVGVIVSIYVTSCFAQKFGKSVGFTIGLILLPFIFYPMLAFGDAEYEGDSAPRRKKRRKKPRIAYEEETEEREAAAPPMKRNPGIASAEQPPETISVVCKNPLCHRKLRGKPEMIGRKVKCPTCGHVQVMSA